tara:strand:+ start:98855 stop:100201 length:1347 start_codon:yes stop_codon:yes gene_type:complete
VKRNGILFSILVILLTFTYFYQEKGDIQKTQEKKVNQNLVNTQLMGDLIGISNSHIAITRDESKVFRTKNGHPIDPRKLQAFLEALSDLRVVEILPNEKINDSNYKEFFPTEKDYLTFKFLRGEMTFILGAKLQFDRNFYVKIIENGKAKYVVAENLSASKEVYSSSQSHNNSSRYNKFAQLLNWKANQLREARVFGQRGLEEKELLSLKIENIRNKGFELLFNSLETIPAPPKSILIHPTMFNIFKQKALNLQGYDSYPRKEELKEEIGTITYRLTNDRYYMFTLFKKYGGRDGYFFSDDKKKVVFESGKKLVDIFFSHVQEVWKLKPLETKVNQITIKFGKRVNQVNLSHQGTFVAKNISDQAQAQNGSFYKLSELLNKRATYLIFDSKQRILGRDAFSITVQGKIFQVVLAKGELILWNEQEKFGYVWKVPAHYPIPVNYESYFL